MPGIFSMKRTNKKDVFEDPLGSTFKLNAFISWARVQLNVQTFIK